MDLGTFAVIFVFTSEAAIGEAVEDFGDGFGWFGQHGLERDAGLELADVLEVPDLGFHELGDNDIVTWKFTIGC